METPKQKECNEGFFGNVKEKIQGVRRFLSDIYHGIEEVEEYSNMLST